MEKVISTDPRLLNLLFSECRDVHSLHSDVFRSQEEEKVAGPSFLSVLRTRNPDEYGCSGVADFRRRRYGHEAMGVGIFAAYW